MDLSPRCRMCGYSLVGLTVPRCPDCGTDFDFRDVTSFSRGTIRDLFRGCPQYAFGALTAAMLLAFLITPAVVGHGPIPFALVLVPCPRNVLHAVVIGAAYGAFAALFASRTQIQTRRYATLSVIGNALLIASFLISLAQSQDDCPQTFFRPGLLFLSLAAIRLVTLLSLWHKHRFWSTNRCSRLFRRIITKQITPTAPTLHQTPAPNSCTAPPPRTPPCPGYPAA
jgi:hypothetical protein